MAQKRSGRSARTHDKQGMKEFCENQFCQNPGSKVVPVSVERPSDQKRTLCAACEEAYAMGIQHATKMAKASRTRGLLIDPPTRQTQGEPLFRVVYVIDVNATKPLDAAKQAHSIMTDPESWRPVVNVISHTGKVTHIDLANQKSQRARSHR